MTVVRFATRLGVVLVCATGWAALPAAPAGAAPGFATAITELPGRFDVGEDAATVTAVISTSLGGECRKVRWSLVLRARGVRLDQVDVDRIEANGSVPLDVRTAGGSVRLTDRALDPGTLCRNRTVTAQYRVAVDDDAPNGELTLAVEAYDVDGRLLDEASATREVVAGRGGSAPQQRRTATPEPPRPTPTEVVPTEEATEAAPVATGDAESPVLADGSGAEGGGAGSGADRTGNAGVNGIGLSQLGFIGGGLLLFLGGGLLLRIWTRNRSEAATTAAAHMARYPPRYPARAGTAQRRARGARTSADW